MFGDNLKKYRIAKGLSQSDIAQKIFVTRQCVSKWENGITQPDLQTLSRLSEVLGVSVDALLKDEADSDNKKPLTHNVGLFIANILIAIFCMFAFVAVWRFAPQTIPAHWTRGTIDRYGSRDEIFLHLITPVLSVAVEIIVYFSVKRTDDKIAAYIAHGVIALLQIAYFIFVVALYAKYLNNVLSFVTCLSADLIMCCAVALHPKISNHNYLLGIRTTETIKSPVVWNKTNALGCYLFAGCSSIIYTVNMLLVFDFSYLCLLAYIVPAVIAIEYSKVIYKRTDN